MVSTCTISRQVLGTSVFTGHDFDDETDLSYMGARYYNGAIGRFISQDTWEGDLRNPQSLNKYSFALNNPIIFYDPDGTKAELSPFLVTGSITHPMAHSLVRQELSAYRDAYYRFVETNGIILLAGATIELGAVSPVAAFTISSLGLKAHSDFQDDGSFNDPPTEYVAVGASSVPVGYALRGLGPLATIVGVGVTDPITDTITGEGVDLTKTGIHALSAGAARFGITPLQSLSQNKNDILVGIGELATQLAELVLTVAGLEAIDELDDEERE